MQKRVFIATASLLAILSISYLLDNMVNSPRLAVENKNFIESSSYLESSSHVLTHRPETRQAENSIQLQDTSLFGTEVDAAKIFVVDGMIMIDHSLRFYYEYFLALQGEVGVDQIKKILAEDAQKRYEPLAAQYVIDLFQRYIDYLHKVSVLISNKSTQEKLLVVEQKILAEKLQAKIFTDVEITVLFDDEFLTAYEGGDTRQASYEHYQEMQKQFPDASLEVLRVENFGVEVAARMAELDLKRQQWQQRLNSYQCEKKAIEESEGLHELDKSQGVQSLQQRLFNESEIRRLKALEKYQLMQPINDCN